MKIIISVLCLLFVFFHSLLIPAYASLKGPVYTLPVLNSCGFNGDHYLIKGTFSTNGTINHSKTTMVYVHPTYSGGTFNNGGYIYVYKTTSGQTYVPWDDGFSNQSNTYYSSACSVKHELHIEFIGSEILQ